MELPRRRHRADRHRRHQGAEHGVEGHRIRAEGDRPVRPQHAPARDDRRARLEQTGTARAARPLGRSLFPLPASRPSPRTRPTRPSRSRSRRRSRPSRSNRRRPEPPGHRTRSAMWLVSRAVDGAHAVPAPEPRPRAQKARSRSGSRSATPGCATARQVIISRPVRFGLRIVRARGAQVRGSRACWRIRSLQDGATMHLTARVNSTVRSVIRNVARARAVIPGDARATAPDPRAARNRLRSMSARRRGELRRSRCR